MGCPCCAPALVELYEDVCTKVPRCHVDIGRCHLLLQHRVYVAMRSVGPALPHKGSGTVGAAGPAANPPPCVQWAARLLKLLAAAHPPALHCRIHLSGLHHRLRVPCHSCKPRQPACCRLPGHASRGRGSASDAAADPVNRVAPGTTLNCPDRNTSADWRHDFVFRSWQSTFLMVPRPRRDGVRMRRIGRPLAS